MKVTCVQKLLENAARDSRLVVEVFHPGAIGGTPCVDVEAVSNGFDWDHGKVLLITKQPLTVLSPEDVAAIRESVSKGQSWHAYEAHKKQKAQIDALRAALESLVLFTNPAPSNAVALNNAHQVLAQVKGGADFPPLTATGAAHEGASGIITDFAKKMLNAEPAPRFTSVSKGGIYERLGAIRGAGSLKGLTGTAYRDEKGALFIREPECFAKRMVLIKPEGDAL